MLFKRSVFSLSFLLPFFFFFRINLSVNYHSFFLARSTKMIETEVRESNFYWTREKTSSRFENTTVNNTCVKSDKAKGMIEKSTTDRINNCSIFHFSRAKKKKRYHVILDVIRNYWNDRLSENFLPRTRQLISHHRWFRIAILRAADSALCIIHLK